MGVLMFGHLLQSNLHAWNLASSPHADTGEGGSFGPQLKLCASVGVEVASQPKVTDHPDEVSLVNHPLSGVLFVGRLLRLSCHAVNRLLPWARGIDRGLVWHISFATSPIVRGDS
ncbi:hypothetical protein BHM03_00053075 [Ensete ventricosum]|nr:hypothetical protein BHM03_00053075 [Ensete ventricosum]